MAWRARKPGSEFPVEIRRDGEVLFTAWFRQPTIDAANEIRRVDELRQIEANEAVPYYAERMVLGRMLSRIDGIEFEDGSKLSVVVDAVGLLDSDCAAAILEFLVPLTVRALQAIGSKGIDDVKN